MKKKTQHDINYNQCRAGSLYTIHAQSKRGCW